MASVAQWTTLGVVAALLSTMTFPVLVEPPYNHATDPDTAEEPLAQAFLVANVSACCCWQQLMEQAFAACSGKAPASANSALGCHVPVALAAGVVLLLLCHGRAVHHLYGRGRTLHRRECREGEEKRALGSQHAEHVLPWAC